VIRVACCWAADVIQVAKQHHPVAYAGNVTIFAVSEADREALRKQGIPMREITKSNLPDSRAREA
jgi:hypothetical protein